MQVFWVKSGNFRVEIRPVVTALLGQHPLQRRLINLNPHGDRVIAGELRFLEFAIAVQRRQQVKQQGFPCQGYDLLRALLILQKRLKLLRFLATRQLFPLPKPLLLNLSRHRRNLDPLQIQGHQPLHAIQRQGSASNHHPVTPFTNLSTAFLK